MIGAPRAASAGIAVLILALLLGPRATDPAVAIAAAHMIRDHAAEAIDALGTLRGAVARGLDEAREGAAAVVSGADPPRAQLELAAQLIADAEREALLARRAVAALAAVHRAWRPALSSPAQPVEVGELGSIASQLRASAAGAEAFARRRALSTGLPVVLGDALRALDRGDLASAAALARRARADHDAITNWETDLATLPVWIETTDAMIGAVEQIVDATRAGDDDAAIKAGEAFVALGDEADTADRALRIALGEGGAALTAAPLGQLAEVLGDIEAARATVAAIRADPGR